MYIHYSNKINISLYTSAVKQLSTALKTARHLAAEGVPGSDEAARPIRRVAEVEHRSRIVGTQGDGGNELAAVGWLAFELVKIAFNIEVILFHRFTGSIATHRDAIHDVFRFIGRTDAAISVMRLRRAANLPPDVHRRQIPRSRAGRASFDRGLHSEHPDARRHGAAAHRVEHVGQNHLHPDGDAQRPVGRDPLHLFCGAVHGALHAAPLVDPHFGRHHRRTSYYLQEVLTVKRLLEDADRPAACLFVLDELFKGTNTTERIAAGKAVLARLNRGPHIVLAATHDIELAELLRGDGYELHHFREEVADGRLVFDYCLHTGPLTTRNAIRILELYDYPPELIAEAYDTQQKLLGNG